MFNSSRIRFTSSLSSLHISSSQDSYLFTFLVPPSEFCVASQICFTKPAFSSLVNCSFFPRHGTFVEADERSAQASVVQILFGIGRNWFHVVLVPRWRRSVPRGYEAFGVGRFECLYPLSILLQKLKIVSSRIYNPVQRLVLDSVKMPWPSLRQ